MSSGRCGVVWCCVVLYCLACCRLEPCLVGWVWLSRFVLFVLCRVVLCCVVLCCVVLCCVVLGSFRFGSVVLSWVGLGSVGFEGFDWARFGSVRRKWVSFVPSQVVSFRRCTTRSQHAHIHVSVQSTILNNRA